MASMLRQIQSKAAHASAFVSKQGCGYVQSPPSIEKCNEVSKQLFYTRLASIPGRYDAFWKELDCVKQMWKNKQDLKVEDAGIATLFALELYAWWCTGEIVGRGFTFTGYKV